MLSSGLACGAQVEPVFRGPFAVAAVPLKAAPELAQDVGPETSWRTPLSRCARLSGDGGREELLLAGGAGAIELSFDDDMTNGLIAWVMPSGRERRPTKPFELLARAG